MLYVLQHVLQLEIRVFYSRDLDEIYCKMRTTEDNFKVIADLSDYHLQFEKRESETYDF